jgi:S1-C subfamily serine protease
MAKASDIRSTTCASCGVDGPIQIGAGSVCAACQSALAWKTYATTPLVIGHSEAKNAARVAEARPSRVPWILHGCWALMSFALLLLAGYWAVGALAPLEVAGLSKISDIVESTSSYAMWSGLMLFVVGTIGVVSLRRSLNVRSFTLLSVQCLAIVVGIAAGAIGGFQGLGAKSDHIPFRSMPPMSQLDGLGISPAIQSIAESTVVVLAPDEDGDARYSAIGTGAIIASTSDKAWIVTCSHVVIPYISTAAVRDPADTHKVWVEFSDGRGVEGAIVWTAPPPLDVAIVSAEIHSPPPAIEISPSTELLDVGSPVIFVPNPLLHGWQVHYGEVAARKTHETPAGKFALVHTSLPVLPGDSGSGLYDEQGRLMGLNTWTRYDEEGSHGISLPSEVLRSMEGAIRRGSLKGLDSLLLSAPTPGSIEP